MTDKWNINISIPSSSQVGSSKERSNTHTHKPEFAKQCEILKGSIDRVALSENVIRSLTEKLPPILTIPQKIPNKNNRASRAPFLDYLKKNIQKIMNASFGNVPNIDMTKLSAHMQKLIMQKLKERIERKSKQLIVITREEMSDIFRLHYSSGCDIPIRKITKSPTQKPQSRAKQRNIEKKNISKSENVSASHHVKDLIKNKKEFDVVKFGSDPVISQIIEDITGKRNGTITPEQRKLIIQQYPLKSMEIRLKSTGKWEEFTKKFPQWKEEFKSKWNTELISKELDKKGENALTIAGVTYGMTVLFGLGGENSSWYREITNQSAIKSSMKKPWKLFLAAGLGMQVAGIPLAETAGQVARMSFNILSQLSYTGGVLFANLFNINKWGEIMGGKETLRPATVKELISMLPKIEKYFKEPNRSILRKFYTQKPGAILRPTHKDIDHIAYLTVANADSLLRNGENYHTNINALEWKRVQLQALSDQSALALARHPDPRIRAEFQMAVRFHMREQREGRFKRLYHMIGGVEKGAITELMNNKAFDDEFEKKAKPVFDAMTPKQRKSVIQMATSHGISGLFVMAWIFIQGSLLATHMVFDIGGKLLKKKSPNNDEPEKNNKKESALVLLKGVLKNSTETSIQTSKDDWKDLSKNLVKIGILGGITVRKLSKLEKKEKKALFNVLKKNEGALDRFTLEKVQSSEIKRMAEVQADIYEVLKLAKVKTALPIGLIEESKKGLSPREKSLKLLIKRRNKLKKWKEFKVKEWKLNPTKPKVFLVENLKKIFGKFYYSAGVTKNPIRSFRGAFRGPLDGVGVKKVFFRELKDGEKANLAYVEKILSTTEDVIKIYETNNSGITERLMKK